MAEWLGNGLQNRVQQFDSAWYLPQRQRPLSRCLYNFEKKKDFKEKVIFLQ